MPIQARKYLSMLIGSTLGGLLVCYILGVTATVPILTTLSIAVIGVSVLIIGYYLISVPFRLFDFLRTRQLVGRSISEASQLAKVAGEHGWDFASVLPYSVVDQWVSVMNLPLVLPFRFANVMTFDSDHERFRIMDVSDGGPERWIGVSIEFNDPKFVPLGKAPENWVGRGGKYISIRKGRLVDQDHEALMTEACGVADQITYPPSMVGGV